MAMLHHGSIYYVVALNVRLVHHSVVGLCYAS